MLRCLTRKNHQKPTNSNKNNIIASIQHAIEMTENEPYFLLCGVHTYLHLGRLVHMQFGWPKFSLGTIVHLLEARLTPTGALSTENFPCCCQQLMHTIKQINKSSNTVFIYFAYLLCFLTLESPQLTYKQVVCPVLAFPPGIASRRESRAWFEQVH